MDKKKYLETLSEQIRYKKALPLIEKELENHIEEQKADFIASGMEEDEAEAAAVLEMGDPVEVGVDMDRIHRPKNVGRLTGGIFSLYCVSSLLCMFMEEHTGLEYFTAWTVLDALLVYLLILGICYFDYSRIGKWAREITFVFLFLTFVSMKVFGLKMNGSLSWLSVWGFTLDMRCASYLFIPLYGGILYRYRGQGYRAVGKCILWMLPPILLTVSYPSLLTGSLILFVFLIMLLWAIVKGWFQIHKKRMIRILGSVVVLFPVLCSFLIWNFGKLYQQERIRAMLFSYNSETAYYLEPLRTAILNSHLFRSSEESLQMLSGYEGVDLTLAYMISYYGIIPALILVGLILVLFIILLKNALKQKNQLGKVMGLGCILSMFVQMTIYVLMNLGAHAFHSGVYGPFIGNSRSGLFVMAVLLGLLVSIYRYQNVVADPETGKWMPAVKREL